MGKNGHEQAKPDTFLELTPQQTLAINLLIGGKNITDTAAALDVRRQTVSDWLHRNPLFKAEYNARRAELWTAHSNRALAVLGLCLDVLEETLAPGVDLELRCKIALAHVKGSGIYGAVVPSGPTDMEQAAAEIERADYARRVRGEELELEQKSQDRDRMLRHLAVGG